MPNFQQDENTASDNGNRAEAGSYRNKVRTEFWIGYAAGLVTMLLAIIGYRHGYAKALATRAPTNSASASPSPVPVPIASAASPDQTIPEADSPKRAASCFQGWTCNCEDERKFCLDLSLGHYVICSKGLVLTFEEYDAFDYGELLYSNACRPQDQPVLNPCIIGRACDEQSLMNREVCVSTDNRLAICNNGRVLDFSNPEARRLVKSESCEDPPPQCAPQSGPDTISL